MPNGTVPSGKPIDPSLALRPLEASGDEARSRLRIRHKFTWLSWLMVLLVPLTAGLSALPGIAFGLIAIFRRPGSFLAWAGLLAQVIGFVVFGYFLLIWGPIRVLPAPLDSWRYNLVIGGIWGDYRDEFQVQSLTSNPIYKDKEGELWYRGFERNTFQLEEVARFGEASGLVVYRRGSVPADQAERIKDALRGFLPQHDYDTLRSDLEELERLRYPLTASAHRIVELIYRIGGDAEYVIFEPLQIDATRRLETFAVLRVDGRRMVIFSAIRRNTTAATEPPSPLVESPEPDPAAQP